MREPMVTRTITGTKAVVLMMNTNTCEPFNKVVNLSGIVTDAEKAIAKIRKEYDTEEEKAVKVVSLEKFESRYGMKESDFIAHAVEMEPLKKS